MNEWFFYQEHGVTHGPVKCEDLIQRIRGGQIRQFDLVFREGDPGWRMALEYPEFRNEFPGQDPEIFRERPWVCLQVKNQETFQFTTTGPFSLEEVRERLMAGRLKYTDYVWRKEFGEWRRIGQVEEFNPRLRSSGMPLASPAVDEDGEELLKNVVELRRPQIIIPSDETPPEAETPDLTKLPPEEVKRPTAPAPPPIPKKESKSEKAETKAEAKAKGRKRSRRSRRRKTLPWFDWGIIVILILVLSGVALILSRAIRPPRVIEAPVAPTTTPSPYTTSAPEEPAKVEPVEPVEPPKPPEPPPTTQKKSPPRPPTQLSLRVHKVGPNQARFEIRANGSVEFPIYIQVIGLPGQVTSGGHFYQFLKLEPNADPRQPLDLSQLQLPQGRFVIRATTGDLKKEASFELGVNDPQYKVKVGRMRKLYAYSIWNERLTLFRLADLLEQRISQGLKRGTVSFRGLESLNDVKLTNGQKYALYEEWWSLKELFQSARKGVSPSLLKQVRKFKDEMATFSVWK